LHQARLPFDTHYVGGTPGQANSFVSGTAVQRGSNWRYHDKGLNLGTAWRQANYSDSSWDAGDGLLGYPTLQSADILAYKGEFVPVGKDQEAHVNMTRDLAQRFNSLYGSEVFPITRSLLTETAKVPGLDSVDRKMSKSAGNYIALNLDEKETTQKVRSMFTDPVKIRKDDPGHPDGCVVYAFHGIYDRAGQATVRSECESGARGCVDCKMQLASLMNGALRPIRERRADLEAHPERVRGILGAGADRARAVAGETLREVRDVMNIPTRENV